MQLYTVTNNKLPKVFQLKKTNLFFLSLFFYKVGVTVTIQQLKTGSQQSKVGSKTITAFPLSEKRKPQLILNACIYAFLLNYIFFA